MKLAMHRYFNTNGTHWDYPAADGQHRIGPWVEVDLVIDADMVATLTADMARKKISELEQQIDALKATITTVGSLA